MKIILLGAPGAGKGSQAVKLTDYYGIPHISTGDAFRMNIKNQTEIGLYAKSFMDQGLLVPDDVTVKIVESRLKEADCKDGFMLDGFPRTIPQAEALDKITKLDYVIHIKADFDVVYKRLCGRKSCTCGKIYNTATYAEATCAACGKTLFVRDDDKDEAIQKRLDVYTKTTAPLIDYYAAKGILVEVEGNGTVQDTFDDIARRVKKA